MLILTQFWFYIIDIGYDNSQVQVLCNMLMLLLLSIIAGNHHFHIGKKKKKKKKP